MKVVIEKYKITVLEKLSVGWIVKCAMCNATGIKPGYSETNCPSCEGIGKRKLLLPENADLQLDWGPVFCGFCQGTGIKPGYSETKCSLCDGKGLQTGAFPRVKCSKCNGSGIKPGYSETPCDGRGCEGRGTVNIDYII